MSNPLYEDIGLAEDKLIEECSELIKAICKAKRFGWDRSHPKRLHYNNYQEFLFEYADVENAFEKLNKKLIELEIK